MRLDDLLKFTLEKATALTSSDCGGAIFVFETLGDGTKLVASTVQGKLTKPSAHLLKVWKQNPDSPIWMMLQSGTPCAVDDHQQDPLQFPWLDGARSSLWVPLLEGKRVIGIICVGSSQPNHFDKPYLQQLHDLASELVPAVFRQILRQQMAQLGAPVEIMGCSTSFLMLERQIRMAAQSKSPVLITGERGSGKELTAWAIHCWSDRRDQPFVPVLASTFAESLFADELFGHERYAFTGAASERRGKFKAAEGGTIFLDEVGDMTPVVQSALLRIIERGELSRIGRDLPLQVDVRVIAATNQTLSVLISQGRFREDLYDRLSIFEITVPPLRERQEDIPLLAQHFLRKYCQQIRCNVIGAGVCAACQSSESVGCATPDFYEGLQNYGWPGNVRELEKLILRLLAFVPDEILDAKHLPEHFRRNVAKAAEPQREDFTLNMVIRNHIERVLQVTNYNQSRAARLLGLPFSTLQSKIKKLGINIKRQGQTPASGAKPHDIS